MVKSFIEYWNSLGNDYLTKLALAFIIGVLVGISIFSIIGVIVLLYTEPLIAIPVGVILLAAASVARLGMRG